MKVYCEQSNLSYKILLLVDNCNGHPPLTHENVKVHFLPANTTSVLQPMDQGAISIMKTHFKYKLLEEAIKFSAGNQKNLMDFLKQVDLLDAINWVTDSWNEVPESALFGVWNKVLLYRNKKTFEPDIDTKVDEIVEMGQSLGITDIDAETVKMSLEVQAEFMSDEDLIFFDNELNGKEKNEDNDSDDEDDVQPLGLNNEKISRIIQCITEAQDLAVEFDINFERALSFQNGLKSVLQPYKELFKQQTEKSKKQQNISSFLAKATPGKSQSSEEEVGIVNEVEVEMNDSSRSKIGQLFAKQTCKKQSVAEKMNQTKDPEVVDLDFESVHDDRLPVCHHCYDLATHFCKTCDTNLCKVCIVSHYKNQNFKRDHEMIPI